MDCDALSREYGSATIFILPSVRAWNGDMDGMPIALMEAMHLQIPVISSKILNIRNIYVENKTINTIIIFN